MKTACAYSSQVVSNALEVYSVATVSFKMVHPDLWLQGKDRASGCGVMKTGRSTIFDIVRTKVEITETILLRKTAQEHLSSGEAQKWH
jgi:hypothetical protein